MTSAVITSICTLILTKLYLGEASLIGAGVMGICGWAIQLIVLGGESHE